MRVYRGLDELPSRRRRSVVTIGNFDSVHRGHRALTDRLLGLAADSGADPTLVTFDPHPRRVLRGEAPCELTSEESKLRLLDEAGLKRVVILTFNRELSLVEPEDFVRRILVDELRTAAVVVGSRFRFGHKAAGDVHLLRSMGREEGFEVLSVRLRRVAGRTVSSTAIRAAVEGGDLDWANRALGRAYSLPGTIVRGHRRGASLGFPTANLDVPSGMCVPKTGIYAGYLDLEGARRPAAISVGTNPQFGRNPLTVEAFIIGFEGELYGRHAEAVFVARLRDEKRFRSRERLIEAMERDVARTREVLRARR
jgi:riboflavin kinase/FMN adenylyltransferase